MTLLLLLLLKSLLVFTLSGLALLCLRRASAAARHLVCLLTLAALLALPLFSAALPGWQVTGLTTADRMPTPQEVPPAPNNGGVRTNQAEAKAALASAPAKASSAAPAPPSAPASTPAPPLLGAGEFLLAFYLLGIACAALRPLLGLWGIGYLRRACTSVADAPTLSVYADCAAALGVKLLPLLCRADAPVPMTWGWHKPVILLPLGSETWPEDRLKAVLRHELAHVKRGDWACHRLADFACALYWFHPLVWLTARRLRAESEAACDDLVLASGIPAPDYARHLLDIAGALPPASRRPPHPAAIAMAQTSQIKGRIAMILDKTLTRRAVPRRALLLAAVPAAAALVALAVLRPSVKAQAAPAPVASLAAAPQLPSLSVTSLAMNGKPLLAGMTNAGKPGSAWWSTTGALLPTPVYDTAVNRSMNDSVQERKPDNTLIPTNNVIFAFRLPAAAQGLTFQYKLPDESSSSNGAWPGKFQRDAGHTESQMFASTGGAHIVTAAFPAALKKTSIQAGIAAGAWKTAVSETVGPAGASQGTSRDGSSEDFILSPAVETAEGLLLTVATNTTDDIRVVAISTQGQTLFPADIDGESVNSLDQITVHFSQPVSQIKAFRVETRPFQWIEFKDVALQPAQQTGKA